MYRQLVEATGKMICNSRSRWRVASAAAAHFCCLHSDRVGALTTSRHVLANAFKLRRSSSTSLTMGSVSYPTLDSQNLVSVDDCLAAYKQNPSGIAFVDGSWYHRSDRSGRKDFEAGPRLPNGNYCDMDDICAKGEENPKKLPHMMPSKRLFAAAMDEFGIHNDQHVVVYGRDGCVFTPRTWFLFQQMGHDKDKLHLMQGSLEEWAEKGGPIEEGTTKVMLADNLDLNRESDYLARDPRNIIDMDGVLEAVKDTSDDAPRILDPRGTTFAKSHIPRAINVPYKTIVTDNDLLKFKSKEELQRIFDAADVDVGDERKIILSCGSGVSVCHLWLALEECGRDNSLNTLIYDGSWSEWGADEDTPKSSTSL